MQQLLRIFFTNGSFFTFVALQLLSLYCIISFNSPQKAIAAETWSIRAGSVRSATETARSYLDLEQENEALRQEVARLRQQSPESLYATERIVDSFRDETFVQRYNFLTAHVVNRSPYRPNNTLIIDRGKNLDVRPGQGIVSPTGIVGIVDQVTGNHARVLSVLHQSIRISAGLASGAFGTLRWDGRDPRYVTVTDLADYIEVQAGDTIFSTGYSNVFPTHQVIGFVVDSEVQPGTGSQNLTVALSNKPVEESNVFVVQDLFKDELSDLATE
ncbi:rod shape-determining protein MreC [Neolewinella antarctica]|uniref:Cell shape-determining protein MreC n=1 Tax=Neolewinella antarctica TaxID=442734 RepID=A0ABX0XAS7_9BACT|nr:rod shape-determining protein MreC [Neolewinella antarctica]NJC26322.1 rod shape-determining protein MreC [Neolewinella antarctica]